MMPIFFEFIQIFLVLLLGLVGIGITNLIFTIIIHNDQNKASDSNPDNNPIATSTQSIGIQTVFTQSPKSKKTTLVTVPVVNGSTIVTLPGTGSTQSPIVTLPGTGSTQSSQSTVTPTIPQTTRKPGNVSI
jgi:hypothetical protein